MNTELRRSIVDIVSSYGRSEIFEIGRWFWKDPMVKGLDPEKVKQLTDKGLDKEKVEMLYDVEQYKFFGLHTLVTEIEKDLEDHADVASEIGDLYVVLGEAKRAMDVLFGMMNECDCYSIDDITGWMEDEGWTF